MTLDTTISIEVFAVFCAAAIKRTSASNRHMLQAGGPAAFMRGWGAMFARMAPTSALTFFLYEQIRTLLGLKYLD